MIRVGVQQGLQCCTNQNPSDLAAALCRILLEISLLDSAYMRSGVSQPLKTEKRCAACLIFLSNGVRLGKSRKLALCLPRCPTACSKQ